MLPVLGVLLAQCARYVVIAAVQLGIFALIEKWVLPQINKCIVEIMTHLNVPEDVAKDIMANEVLKAGEEIGIFAATMKTKIPLKVASLLGFTTKGWAKRAVGAEILKKFEQKSASGLLSKSGTLLISKLEAPTAIELAKTAVKGFAPAYKIVLNTLGVGFVGFIAVNNFIDFGNWNSGAYQKTMQKVIETVSFGLLRPDKDWERPTVISDSNFETVYNAYKLAGATKIINNWDKTELPFTRENLIDLLDRIASQLLLTGEQASVKNVMQASTLFVIVSGGTTTTTQTTTTQTTTTTPTVKVFTGIVTQGTIGNPSAFVARQTDLIDDMTELQEAAQNNLASFIVALPGKIVYEIKVVSSVTTKDGFVQRGTTQKIISGYFTNGQPKYRTVTNKFATLNVYILNEKNNRTKIATVVLGPVNAASFSPTAQEIQIAEQQIKANITTTDVEEIQQIVTTQPVVVETPPAQVEKPTIIYDKSINNPVLNQLLTTNPIKFYVVSMPGDPNFTIKTTNLTNFSVSGREVTKQTALNLAEQHAQIMRDNRAKIARNEMVAGPTGDPEVFLTEVKKELNRIPDPIVEKYVAPWGELLTNVPLSYVRELEGTTAAGAEVPTSNNPNKCNVSTIAEFFDVNKTNFPKVEQRAELYELWGLGLKAYYTGTAEQNNKFLAEAKRRSGC